MCEGAEIFYGLGSPSGARAGDEDWQANCLCPSQRNVARQRRGGARQAAQLVAGEIPGGRGDEKDDGRAVVLTEPRILHSVVWPRYAGFAPALLRAFEEPAPAAGAGLGRLRAARTATDPGGKAHVARGAVESGGSELNVVLDVFVEKRAVVERKVDRAIERSRGQTRGRRGAAGVRRRRGARLVARGRRRRDRRAREARRKVARWRRLIVRDGASTRSSCGACRVAWRTRFLGRG